MGSKEEIREIDAKNKEASGKSLGKSADRSSLARSVRGKESARG